MNIFSFKQQALMVLFVVGSFTASADGDFTAITDGVENSITSINISPSTDCGDIDGSVPAVMWTIEPGDDGVTVETSPADLFIVSSSGGILSFQWNPAVASSDSSSGGAGVKINLPASQLKSVTVGDEHKAQILDGFTSVTSVESSGIATLHATFTSSSSTDFSVDTSGEAEMYVKSNVAITGGQIVDDSEAKVETPSYRRVIVSDSGILYVKGDVGSGSVSDSAYLTVTGTITGSIKSSDSAFVNAPSCENVSSSDSSDCDDVSSQSVDVDVSNQGETGGADGKYCPGGDNLSISATDSKITTTAVAAIAAATTGAVAALLI